MPLEYSQIDARHGFQPNVVLPRLDPSTVRVPSTVGGPSTLTLNNALALPKPRIILERFDSSNRTLMNAWAQPKPRVVLQRLAPSTIGGPSTVRRTSTRTSMNALAGSESRVVLERLEPSSVSGPSTIRDPSSVSGPSSVTGPSTHISMDPQPHVVLARLDSSPNRASTVRGPSTGTSVSAVEASSTGKGGWYFDPRTSVNAGLQQWQTKNSTDDRIRTVQANAGEGETMSGIQRPRLPLSTLPKTWRPAKQG